MVVIRSYICVLIGTLWGTLLLYMYHENTQYCLQQMGHCCSCLCNIYTMTSLKQFLLFEPPMYDIQLIVSYNGIYFGNY